MIEQHRFCCRAATRCQCFYSNHPDLLFSIEKMVSKCQHHAAARLAMRFSHHHPVYPQMAGFDQSCSHCPGLEEACTPEPFVKPLAGLFSLTGVGLSHCLQRVFPSAWQARQKANPDWLQPPAGFRSSVVVRPCLPAVLRWHSESAAVDILMPYSLLSCF